MSLAEKISAHLPHLRRAERVGAVVAHFALVLDDKEAPLNTPSEAHKLMKIIDGIYASAKTGRPVELTIEDA
jgi:predicted dehydrogenase